MDILIPPINAKGRFTFKAPFDKLLKDDLSYKVTALRSLVELYENESKPYEVIYEANSIPKEEYIKDLENSVPIVTLTTTGTDFYYVPASYILSTPMLTGYKYHEVVIAVKLGLLPENYNYNTALQMIGDIVRDTLGVETEAKAIPASSTILVEELEHEKLKKLLDNSKNEFKSYKTKYQELLVVDKAKDDTIKELEKEIIKLIKKQNELNNKITKLESW